MVTIAETAGHTILGKYTIYDGDEDITGEGTSSICRRGVCLATKQPVAIKVYKTKGKGSSRDKVNKQKFRRQIEVLKELMKPLEEPDDSTLWCETLAKTDPTSLFTQLLDYSKDAKGDPGPDPEDGQMYVVTELASYSLKDFLKSRKERQKPLSKESVWDITKAILLVMAGLHAKGLVHLDLKPENLMLFDGRLKLIDVDGCVPIGGVASIDDSSLSFSPCYCAPEWAAFLIEDSDLPTITIHPALDVWSVGMTICEAISLEAHLKPTYASFMRHGRSHREAGFHFMDWLSQLKKVDLPDGMDRHDPQLVDMLSNYLLVPERARRASLAQALMHPYISSKDSPTKSDTSPDKKAELNAEAAADANIIRRQRLEDHALNIIFKNKLWKLQYHGDTKEKKDWLVRDIWITNNGSLCYFSPSANKRLVLLDGHQLQDALVSKIDGCAKQNAFKITAGDDQDMDKAVEIYFACDTPEERETWLHELAQAHERCMQTMHLGTQMAKDVRAFRCVVTNRRLKVGNDESAVFSGTLWKVKTDGDRMKEEDWFEREMWLSANGNLVYYSKKEQKELVHYTAEDIGAATIIAIPAEQSLKPFTFQVQLPPADGIEFAPGEFSAESEELRDRWMEELAKFSHADR